MTEMPDFGELLSQHYTTLVLVIIFGIKLYIQRSSKTVDLRYFWVTEICCALLVPQDMIESVTAMDPRLWFLRVLFSIIGYTLRPVAMLGLLLVACPPERRTRKLWIPIFVNVAVFLTAFFSPAAFSYNENYGFVRGPLGYTVFVVSFLYMFLILATIHRRFYAGKTMERLLMTICAAACFGATVFDMIYGGHHLTEALMISSIFFYFFLNAHDNRLDPVTSLGNRVAFYADIDDRKRFITAIASMDMNGLKAINDAGGHAAGDKALAEVGRCLKKVGNRNTTAYRIGGDEFAFVFLQQKQEAVEQTIAQAKELVDKAGLSISIGYAMMAEGESAEDLLKRSDHDMYSNKAAYYRMKGHDRRAR